MARSKKSKESQEDGEFPVESILDRKKEGRGWLFLVKWEGFDASYNTWEPTRNVKSCIQYKEFMRSVKSPKKQSTKTKVEKKQRVDKASTTTKTSRRIKQVSKDSDEEMEEENEAKEKNQDDDELKGLSDSEDSDEEFLRLLSTHTPKRKTLNQSHNKHISFPSSTSNFSWRWIEQTLLKTHQSFLRLVDQRTHSSIRYLLLPRQLDDIDEDIQEEEEEDSDSESFSTSTQLVPISNFFCAFQPILGTLKCSKLPTSNVSSPSHYLFPADFLRIFLNRILHPDTSFSECCELMKLLDSITSLLSSPLYVPLSTDCSVWEALALEISTILTRPPSFDVSDSSPDVASSPSSILSSDALLLYKIYCCLIVFASALSEVRPVFILLDDDDDKQPKQQQPDDLFFEVFHSSIRTTLKLKFSNALQLLQQAKSSHALVTQQHPMQGTCLLLLPRLQILLQKLINSFNNLNE